MADEDGWIPLYNEAGERINEAPGGETLVFVRMRDGVETHEPHKAEQFNWERATGENYRIRNSREKFDITHYKPFEE